MDVSSRVLKMTNTLTSYQVAICVLFFPLVLDVILVPSVPVADRPSQHPILLITFTPDV
jgi:hypothetical protein